MSSSKDFDTIYQEDVINALKNDPSLNWPSNQDGKKLTRGTCPGCGKKELYISLENPYRLACNRLDKCGFTQNTRERYPELFERLSEKYPVTPENPNATADVYMSSVRGFPLNKIKGLYKQGQVKIKDGSLAEAVQFNLCGGHWSRLIDQKSIKANDNRKAMIDYGLRYQGSGWITPNTQFKDGETIYIVEGIFHAIAFYLMGYCAIAAISCNNLPTDFIQTHKDKDITWVLAYDNDEAGRKFILKYYPQLKEQGFEVRVAITEGKADWDDVYKAGNLDESYIEKSLYRGRLLTANSKESKAYFIYEETQQGFYLVDFNFSKYSVKVNTTEYHDDINKEDNKDGELATFKRHVTITQICNCIPLFKYIEIDTTTKEQRYYFEFQFFDKSLNCTVPFTPSAIANAQAFCKEMLSRTPGGNFKGTDKILSILRDDWLKQIKIVKTLCFIGYDEDTGIYCYQHFGYKDGQRLEINKEGYIEAGKDFIKTTLETPDILEATQVFNTHWFKDFEHVHHLNGLAVLAWWTASLFSQQIKQRQKSWCFLELTGEANAGKSTLIRFLWALLGRPNQEGVKPGEGATTTGLRRSLSQITNMPMVLIEADQEQIINGRTVIKQYPWDSLKELFDYNGILRSTGVKTNGNETQEFKFKATICISQNNSVEGTEAILTRIAHFHATKEHHTSSLKKIADKLNNLEPEFLAGYLEHVLKHQNQWLGAYFESFPKYESLLQKNSLIKNSRIILNHAQVMAAAYATKQLFSQWSDDTMKALIDHITSRAIKRQQRISKEPEALSDFWGHYHFINESSDLGEVLNLSPNPDQEIAINLTHFIGVARDYGIYIDVDIKKLFPKSTTYPLKGNKAIRSPKRPKTTTKCWIFAKEGGAQ